MTMVKGGGGGGSTLLGWLGLLGLIVAAGVGAALGYFEAVRRSEANDFNQRIHYMQAEIILLRNVTEHLQQQLQAQEKKLEEDKTPQYYDDNNDYYDEDSYDDYRDDDVDTVQDPPLPGSTSTSNRTRRSILQDVLAHNGNPWRLSDNDASRRRRAVGASGDKYNLIISEGPRKPGPPRVDQVKAFVIIDPSSRERPRTISDFRPRIPTRQPPYVAPTTRPWVVDHTRSPNVYEEQKYREDRIRHEKSHDDNCCTSIAVQFGADSTKWRSGGHAHYDSNHRMYHPDGLFKDWVPYVWGVDYDSHFSMDSGHLTVITPGLYYLYAQIFYAAIHDTSGYKVYVNNVAQLQCTVTSVTDSYDRRSTRKIKNNSCHTGGLVRLQPSDKITLREVEGHRYTVFEPTKSFFGLYRIANI